jgi:adenylate cyclase
VENKLSLGYEYLGEQTVKNIAKPVRVYRVLIAPEAAGKVLGEKKTKTRQWQRSAIGLVVILIIAVAAVVIWRLYTSPTPKMNVASKEKMAFPLPDKPSIAVLPFDNLSGDPRQEPFADGVTENITTTLSKIPGLFVIARNSAFEYKGKPIDVKKVAGNLGVKHILEGSVQKSGERIRITAQLIDATSGHHIWSEKYDREMRDLFALTDDVTRNIAVSLQIKLTEGEQARVFHKDTENLEAWALATQAWDLIARTREDNARARELADQAVKLDPQYGFAWSLLAYSYFNAAKMGWCESPEEYYKKAIELNQKALSLNKDLFCATAMLGQIHLAQRQYERAIEMGRRSIELGPSIAVNYLILGETLCYAGNFEEAITLGEKALSLHPMRRNYYLNSLARSYRMAGRYEEALALYRETLHRFKNPLPAYIGLAEVYSEMGRVEEAHTQALEVLRINPSFSLENWSKTEPFRDPKHLEKRLTALRKAGLT